MNRVHNCEHPGCEREASRWYQREDDTIGYLCYVHYSQWEDWSAELALVWVGGTLALGIPLSAEHDNLKARIKADGTPRKES